MKFDDAQQVEQICWSMKEADLPRGDNRALIQNLFNGSPPYSQKEEQENGIEVNVNFLESTRLAHDARAQFNNAFMKPGNFFGMRTDAGPVHKRSAWNAKVTRAINRRMKRSLPYFEKNRSTFGADVLHGIGPGVWRDQDHWCPDAAGIEDILIPSKTLLTMQNLPFFPVYRSYTAPELIKATRGPNRDPGWNMAVVNACLEWIDQESMALMGQNWPEIWSPEKMQERMKSDGGFYVGDSVPTIDTFDFYFYSDEGKDSGWRRRIILDAWSAPAGTQGMAERRGKLMRKNGSIYQNAKQNFLYTSGKRKFCEEWRNIIGFQFADLSCKTPFEYHSVRSLGFLLYSVCHLQNRLRCRFTEAVFEALMMYFRIRSMDDAQRALKVDLINRGFIEEGVNPIPAAERYQVNAPLVQLGLTENANLIRENSSSYTQNTNYSQGGVEKTKFQVLAETNAMTSLVSAALSQAYFYQNFENREIVRRFFKANSMDPEVREVRDEILKEGVPEKYLVPQAWDTEPERVMGAGNKTLEMTIAGQLMEWQQKFDPEPQRIILRDAVTAITDDAAKAELLVPEKPVAVSDSVETAQLAAGALMQGLPVGVKTGINHIEYVQAGLVSLAVAIQKAKTRGNMATPDELNGMQNLAQHIAEHIKIIAQDPEQKALVKDFGDKLGKLMNEVKAFAQRLAQAMKAQQQSQGNGQMDPKDQAKIQATMMTAKAKAQNTRESHAARTVQRQLQFEQQMRQEQQKHALEMQRMAEESNLELKAEQAKNRLRSMESE